ncbi:MAG TPA: sigma-70 family RNA polymerase sigma factor [Ilumatobacter sp.]|nr:sigma-70 family RNA polymerase sigma factor [Ilumatobacter sp.]
MVGETVAFEGDDATPATFAELYTTEFGRLVRLATLLTGRTEVARDVVQDAFVKLHVKWASVRNPSAYVQRSVVNGCRSHHRRAARQAVRERTVAAGSDVAGLLDVDHTFATLAALSHRERAVIVLKFYEQRSEAEIAELVGCRPGSVGPTVQRALVKLRGLQ